MKLLIVGGAGYVGQIVCPVIAQEHDCTYLDLQPVSGAQDRTIIADVIDDLNSTTGGLENRWDTDIPSSNAAR